MPYIFGKLWHLAIIWAIRKAFQCILQGVRFLLANHTRLSPTSDNDSCIGLFFSVSLWRGSYFKAISSETECCSTVLAFSVSCVHRSVHLVITLCVLNTLCALRKLWARNPLKIILFCSKFGRWWRIKCWPLKIASYRLLTHFLTFYLKCLLELSSALFTISSPSAV